MARENDVEALVRIRDVLPLVIFHRIISCMRAIVDINGHHLTSPGGYYTGLVSVSTPELQNPGAGLKPRFHSLDFRSTHLLQPLALSKFRWGLTHALFLTNT
jgi:hypothetical protein